MKIREITAEEASRRVNELAEVLCDCVDLITSMPDNQQHRADVAKMLVQRLITTSI